MQQETIASLLEGVDWFASLTREDLDALAASAVTVRLEPGEIVFRVGTAGDTFAGPVSIRLVGETRTLTGCRVMDTATRLS